VSSDLELAEAIAREAGALLLGRFASAERRNVAAKSTPTDLVSQADHDSERLIRLRLAEHRPDDGILGEEGDDVAGTSGRRWVVDPLDGTVNFLFGIPQWAVSIAVEDAESVIAGVVYDPVLDECWEAERDGPPLMNGTQVTASTRDDLATALVATGFGYDAGVREVQAERVARLLPRVRDIRRAGSAALDIAWTAAGRHDAYFERGVQHWDLAAAALVCERAGLTVVRLDPDPPAAGGLLVAPAGLVEELLSIVG
jgi:myo-inositol-1(or 4)-monophosphatase